MSGIYGQYAPQGAAVYNSPAAEETKLVKSGAGLLHGLIIANYNAAVRYVFLFDSLTATGTPICPPIPLEVAGSAGSLAALAFPYELKFQTGLFVAASTTGNVYTASAGADLRMTAITK